MYAIFPFPSPSAYLAILSTNYDWLIAGIPVRHVKLLPLYSRYTLANWWPKTNSFINIIMINISMITVHILPPVYDFLHAIQGIKIFVILRWVSNNNKKIWFLCD